MTKKLAKSNVVVLHQQTPLQDLIEQLKIAKETEQQAKLRRNVIESNILRAIEFEYGQLPETGSNNFEDRLNVKNSILYSVDQELTADVLTKVSLPVNVFKVKYEVDVKQLKVLKQNYPIEYGKIVDCITTKAAKPQMTVKY